MSEGFGKQLYQLLPAVYRERDNTEYDINGKVTKAGDMARLLEVYGELLDGIRNTLQQRYYDNFPDHDDEIEDGQLRSCQPWTLPYFAQLLDVRMVSPNAEGQREEVTNAVAWRQRKGTLVSLEQVAQSVAQMEFEMQEGWQRLARTADLKVPLLPAQYYGESFESEAANPADFAQQPGLATVTPDIRSHSRAVSTDANDPSAKVSQFKGEPLYWRQGNRHSVPCFPNSYQDTSLRTPDLRAGIGTEPQYHPRKINLFTAPPEGYFSADATSIQWTSIKDQSQFKNDVIEITTSETQWRGKTVALIHYRGLTKAPLKIRGVIDITEDVVVRFENLWLDNKLKVDQGQVQMIQCASRQTLIHSSNPDDKVLYASNCLFNKIEAATGFVQIEYCTVLAYLLAEKLNCSDCILMVKPRKDRVDQDVPEAGCIRYSRFPFIHEDDWVVSVPLEGGGSEKTPSDLSYSNSNCTHVSVLFYNFHFGDPGCGVLHPSCLPEVIQGAEDGGEMGAYHDWRLSLRWFATQDKLKDYLPIGMEAVLIPDPTLACRPPINKGKG